MSNGVALITGASAGLGTAFAQALAERGRALVLVARRQERLDELARQLRNVHGVDVTVITADLSSPEAPVHIVDSLNRAELEVDILVNNAGAGGPDLLNDRHWPTHVAYLQLMMLSTTHLCHLLIPGMQARGHGRVINVASVAGRFALAGDGHYGPSKAYVVALSEALAATVKPHGVHVCALCPGFTHTEFHTQGNLRKLKAGVPAFLWYSPAQVVSDALAAVEKGRDICISGRLYRWLDPWLQGPLRRRLLKWLLLRLPDRD